MKRRDQFNFPPFDRCLARLQRKMAHREQNQSSLAEKLGLSPIAAKAFADPNPNHLNHWMNQARYPVWDPGCPLARMLVTAIRNHHPCTFRYHGGSTPGAKRTVYPAQLFTVGSSDTLYLAGWCMNQEAHRTFRIERVELLG